LRLAAASHVRHWLFCCGDLGCYSAAVQTNSVTGRVVYDDSMFWRGVLTLHEVDGRHILKDVAIQKRNGAISTGEFALTQ
jgi:hypothetical protein